MRLLILIIIIFNSFFCLGCVKEEKIIIAQTVETSILRDEFPDEPIPPIEEPVWIEPNPANTCWVFMKRELGWSDMVCAGVMGNLMAETGGCSLDLDPHLYEQKTRSFYGICQWSLLYYPDVRNKNLEYQLNFLKDTVEEEFETFGRLYEENYTYNDFIASTSVEEAALAFAIVYERCANYTYSHRIENALNAYDYYVN